MVDIYDPSLQGTSFEPQKIRVMSTCDFILKSALQYGGSFDYGGCVYTGMRNPITLRCRRKNHTVHITPCFHWVAKTPKCPRCTGYYVRTRDEFIEDAMLIHGDRYDYSVMDGFEKKNNSVKIRCKEHDFIFTQKKPKHLSGQGCPKCIGRHKSTEEFIEEAHRVHYGKYDYSKSVYVGGEKPLTITCPIHGDFQQNPYSHLKGFGCVGCGWEKSSNSNINRPTDDVGCLYLIHFLDLQTGSEFYKIGVTIHHQNPKKRFCDASFHRTVVYKHVAPMSECIEIEEKILKILHKIRYKVRNLHRSYDKGWTECFKFKDIQRIDIPCLVDIFS